MLTCLELISSEARRAPPCVLCGRPRSVHGARCTVHCTARSAQRTRSAHSVCGRTERTVRTVRVRPLHPTTVARGRRRAPRPLLYAYYNRLGLFVLTEVGCSPRAPAGAARPRARELLVLSLASSSSSRSRAARPRARGPLASRPRGPRRPVLANATAIDSNRAASAHRTVDSDQIINITTIQTHS
ncbi:unnamed protein product [Euphydryas editha]|uniref:Uncharacterized protein n=1 Tax=Euphydryas editha TaxID=104508 RepID=A0AAU9TKE6_EUPED|nr:unnamed protein product [Euphydryas editha]